MTIITVISMTIDGHRYDYDDDSGDCVDSAGAIVATLEKASSRDEYHYAIIGGDCVDSCHENHILDSAAARGRWIASRYVAVTS